MYRHCRDSGLPSLSESSGIPFIMSWHMFLNYQLGCSHAGGMKVQCERRVSHLQLEGRIGLSLANLNAQHFALITLNRAPMMLEATNSAFDGWPFDWLNIAHTELKAVGNDPLLCLRDARVRKTKSR